MREKHPVFDSQPDPQSIVWRYFDFPKFTALLARRALYFSRADLLGDPLEGSFTKALEMERNRLRARPPEGQTAEELESVFDQWRRIGQIGTKSIYVNCWHEGDHESMAMWKGYGGGPYGVAIRSTFGRLDEAMPVKCATGSGEQSVFLGRVRYIDYSSETDHIAVGNMYAPFMYKAVAYGHEREVRAVLADIPAGMSGTPAAGHLVTLDVSRLGEKVIVSPLSPAWFEDLVRATCKQFGLDLPIVKSVVSMAPIY